MPVERSIWFESLERPLPRQAPLAADLRADVAIVGAGITGLTLGTLLAEEGLRVAIVERARVGSGTTGSTSAHLTTALDVSYRTLVSRFGEDRMRLVVDSVQRAIDTIEARAGGEGRCGFRRVPGWRFAEERAQGDALEDEARAARRLGVAVEWVRRPELPFAAAAALRFDRQAEFQPVAYLERLVAAFQAAGGRLFEESPVAEVDDDGLRLATGHRVHARDVVDATHSPVGLVASIQTRLAALTSYLLVARLDEPIPRALYWDEAEPYHYVRVVGDDERRVLVGGADHHTGRVADPHEHQRALEAWLRKRLPVAGIEARWSHEFFDPADGLPFIGRLPGSRHRFVAAGFSGTGLTFGTVAALLLRELLLGRESPWAAVYTPRRLGPAAGAARAMEENARIAWRLVADRLRHAGASAFSDIAPDSGRLQRVDGQQLAVYRDARGDVHLLSPRCPHMGCTVRWNDFEKSWDCPCHGGRFHATGKVLYGPPSADLERHEPDRLEPVERDAPDR